MMWLLFELSAVVFDIFGEALLDLAASAFRKSLEKKERGWAEGCLAAALYFPYTLAGCLLAGGLLGAATAWLLPERLAPPPPIPGISLLIAPVAAGLAMHLFGRYRRARGGRTTILATFHGGAAFAFGAALARFLWLR